MTASKETRVFPNRYREHVAYAIKMIALNSFTSSPAAVASVYLNTRFEFYFRILSGRLNADGTWITPQVRNTATKLLNNNSLGKTRINDVTLAYKIMKINQSLSISKHCNKIDCILYPNPVKMPDGSYINDIGDRIKYLRVRSSHGHWGDISAEGIFYGLMTAIVFYNQS